MAHTLKSNTLNPKKSLLTGDTPTGKLHLGHWVGSLENRVKLQDEYDCYFLLANAHAFTTNADNPKTIQENVLAIALDYLSAGIDPKKSSIFIETEAPAIFELAVLLSMLIPFPRVMRNPTVKDEIRDKGLGDHYSFGFLSYPVLQAADILAFRAEVVPVGEDQIPHLELTRDVARRFNQLYCGIDPHSADQDAIKEGGLFPMIDPLVGRVKRLVGTGAPQNGQLLKMSKSLNNTILLSDSPDIIKKKVMSMYTDPNRLRATDPGTVENNPLWVFHDAFNPDTKWVEAAKERYRAGTIGDVECKKQLIDAIVTLLEPMQKRRAIYENDPFEVQKILKTGSEKAREVTDATLQAVKAVMCLN